jgi:topoisomerase IV subunit A
VLEGRMLVLLNIDEVIRIIRAADEPKPALIERFGLTDRQAEDILEIRLRQLARLEAIRIETELKQLREDERKLQEILGSPAVLRRTVVKEIEADAKTHGDDRRTLIEAQKRAAVEIRIVDEPVTVVVSLKGWIRALKGHEVDAATLAFKPGDALYGTFPCRSVDPLIVFGSNGRVYSTPVAQLPSGRGDGQPVTSMIELEPGTQPAHYLAAQLATTLLLAGTGGFGLLAKVGDLVARQRGGKSFLTLVGDEKPLPPALVGSAAERVACLTLNGRLLVFGLDELKLQPGGGRGLTLIDLEAGDALVSAAAFGEALRVVGSGRGGKAKEEVLRAAGLAPHVGRRARKGRAQDAMQKASRVVAES